MMRTVVLLGTLIAALTTGCGNDVPDAAQFAGEDATAETSGSDDGSAGDVPSDGVEPGDVSSACTGVQCVNGSCPKGVCVCSPGWDGDACDKPIQPPSNNLLFHLDGNDTKGNGTQSPLGPLDVWVDKQASVHNFLQKGDARPTVVAGPNGMRVVSFDGKDWMSSGTAFSGITKKFAYTIIVVGHGQDDDNAFLAGTEAKTNLPGLLVETAKAGNVRVLHRMPFGKAGGDDITTAKDPLKKKVLNRIWITRKVATKVSYGIKVNDELTGLQTGSAADFDADLNLVIGRESVVTDSRYLTGEIAEILIYLGEQTPNNNPAIHKYLQDKWGAK